MALQYTDISQEIQSQIDQDEQVRWYSTTNGLPGVISGISRVLFLSVFLGTWPGGYVGDFGFNISQLIRR